MRSLTLLLLVSLSGCQSIADMRFRDRTEIGNLDYRCNQRYQDLEEKLHQLNEQQIKLQENNIKLNDKLNNLNGMHQSTLSLPFWGRCNNV